MVKSLLKHAPTRRARVFDVVQHEWFRAEGINIGELKSVGSFGNNLNTGKPLDVWWLPVMDASSVARYYHGEHGPLSSEEGGLMHITSTADVGMVKQTGDDAGDEGKTGGAELPWHWVF